MKKHVGFRDYNDSVKKLDKLTNDQLVKVEGGLIMNKVIPIFIFFPPGYAPMPPIDQF